MLMYISRLGWAVDATANQIDIFYVCTLHICGLSLLLFTLRFSSLFHLLIPQTIIPGIATCSHAPVCAEVSLRCLDQILSAVASPQRGVMACRPPPAMR